MPMDRFATFRRQEESGDVDKQASRHAMKWSHIQGMASRCRDRKDNKEADLLQNRFIDWRAWRRRGVARREYRAQVRD